MRHDWPIPEDIAWERSNRQRYQPNNTIHNDIGQEDCDDTCAPACPGPIEWDDER